MNLLTGIGTVAGSVECSGAQGREIAAAEGSIGHLFLDLRESQVVSDTLKIGKEK